MREFDYVCGNYDLSVWLALHGVRLGSVWINLHRKQRLFYHVSSWHGKCFPPGEQQVYNNLKNLTLVQGDLSVVLVNSVKLGFAMRRNREWFHVVSLVRTKVVTYKLSYILTHYGKIHIV